MPPTSILYVTDPFDSLGPALIVASHVPSIDLSLSNSGPVGLGGGSAARTAGRASAAATHTARRTRTRSMMRHLPANGRRPATATRRRGADFERMEVSYTSVRV